MEPKRILVVEDDLLNGMFYQAVLEANDFTVSIVSDGAYVMRRVKEFRPDLITMDIQIPSISGLDLTEMLNADPQFRDISILAITAFAGKGEEARIRKAGASGYLAKPVSIKRLMAEIGALLAPAAGANDDEG
ncbi:two-component system cell cycle response regulator DivK [Altererythrobacter atlanticus]|uniref:Polar-differentiation response regulator DivK n=1 Tax=Croceibacterium atlanticum TaxID=1267766 RepID=A0A0F7KUL9_9SPHN|nr:response regulator [Croceibacterium atlanticum]AKH42480.1 Polar-differentiation response regulator DivK [Croceibacterium atlanticum]MBB5731257.1 two-component system cell cycle response regulator DivK [Croceibacterium atlanticum]